MMLLDLLPLVNVFMLLSINNKLVSIIRVSWTYPNSKVHVANMGPIWGRQDPGGPHVGPMDVVIWVASSPASLIWSNLYYDIFDTLKTSKIYVSLLCQKKTKCIKWRISLFVFFSDIKCLMLGSIKSLLNLKVETWMTYTTPITQSTLFDQMIVLYIYIYIYIYNIYIHIHIYVFQNGDWFRKHTMICIYAIEFRAKGFSITSIRHYWGDQKWG